MVTHSEQFTNTPPQKKVVRVDNYQSQTLICSDGSKGFKCMLNILIKLNIVHIGFSLS